MKKNLIFLFVIATAMNFGCKNRNEAQNGYQVGDYSVYVLTEARGTGDTVMLTGAPEGVLQRLAPDGTFPNAVNAVLVRKNGEVWLADTGFGRNIFAQMDSLGIAPEDVDHVILTHMHKDHIGGMLREGKPAFPNADVRVAGKEYQYWTSTEEMTNAPEERRDIFLLAQQVAEQYRGRIRTEQPRPVDGVFEDGIHMLEAYGHTPGHVVYLIKDGEAEFLIWGDLTHAVLIQTAYPEISVDYDYDPDAARENRMKILEYVSSRSIPVAGMHIPFGGIGMVRDLGDGYVFIFADTQ